MLSGTVRCISFHQKSLYDYVFTKYHFKTDIVLCTIFIMILSLVARGAQVRQERKYLHFTL